MSNGLEVREVSCPNCQVKHNGKNGNRYCPVCEAAFKRVGLASYIGGNGVLRYGKDGPPLIFPAIE